MISGISLARTDLLDAKVDIPNYTVDKGIIHDQPKDAVRARFSNLTLRGRQLLK